MGLKSELSDWVATTFRTLWDEQNTTTVPAPTDLRLDSNHAKKLDNAIVLYADIVGSTRMVDTETWMRSAEIYKTYLHCASRIIRSHGGTITAYDGDRVMAIWPANHRTDAVKSAMKINYAVNEIIRPAFRKQYTTSQFTLNHVIGIDVGTLHAARIGVRGDNDIVWVGTAANHAAKLCDRSGQPIWITKAVYDYMDEPARTSNGVAMWQMEFWMPRGVLETIYSTAWHWEVTDA